MLISGYHELKKAAENFAQCAPTTEELKTEDRRDATGSMVVTVLAALSHILALFLSFPSFLSYRYPSSLF